MRKNVTCITITTDASFHPTHKTSGFAFQIVCDDFRIQHSGKFTVTPAAPHEAEIMCIGNALAALLKVKNLPTAKYLVINTDSLIAIRLIRTAKYSSKYGKINNTQKVKKLWMDAINKICSKKNQFRHVKAHNTKDDKSKRAYVNDWCDKESRKWMRIATKELLQKLKEEKQNK